MSNNVLGIDIGGSKISVGIIDNKGNVVENYKTTLAQKYTEKDIINCIFELIKPLFKHNPKAVGVAIPGLCDTKKGIWKYAPFSGVSNFEIAKIISKKTNLKCFIENDVNICALGEKMYGNAQNIQNFLWITLSNGVGGALYINNQLYVGENGSAGEIGHFYINDRSYVCGCGKRGCLETFVSGQGIKREYFRRTGIEKQAKEIFALSLIGDKEAKATIDRGGKALGKALSYSVNLLNISNIFVGGGVSESLDLLLPSINKSLKKHLFNQANDKVVVKKTALGYDASLIGTGALAQINLRKKGEVL